MCLILSTMYKCHCATYCQLHPCDLHPEIREDASDCPRFGTMSQQIILPYYCTKNVCAVRDQMISQREEREVRWEKEQTRQLKRDLRGASFQRWETAWAREEKRIEEGEEMESAEVKEYIREKREEREQRRIMEEHSQRESEIEKLLFDGWNDMLEQEDIRREEEAERTKVEAEELRQWTESRIADGFWNFVF